MRTVAKDRRKTKRTWNLASNIGLNVSFLTSKPVNWNSHLICCPTVSCHFQPLPRGLINSSSFWQTQLIMLSVCCHISAVQPISPVQSPSTMVRQGGDGGEAFCGCHTSGNTGHWLHWNWSIQTQKTASSKLDRQRHCWLNLLNLRWPTSPLKPGKILSFSHQVKGSRVFSGFSGWNQN